ncbi:MAG: PIN domain-containing protein [Propionibacteriaceae bacterium]|jgi:predicted nucleic-acid-binding protein|nr:PIN domain-containing protein [Propionibacteriaceae bacterium]
MASLDTNCLLRWILGDLPDQQRRVEQLLRTEESLVVEDIVLIEVVFVLERSAGLRRRTIQDCLHAIMSESVHMERSIWNQTMEIWVKHPKLSVVDVFLAVKAESQQDTPVYTFDAKMLSQLSATAPVPA